MPTVILSYDTIEFIQKVAMTACIILMPCSLFFQGLDVMVDSSVGEDLHGDSWMEVRARGAVGGVLMTTFAIAVDH